MKVETKNGFHYVSVGDKKLPVICMKNKTFLYHQDGMERIVNEVGQLIVERKIDDLYREFYKSDSCHRADIYVRNKRACNPCMLMGICRCHLNIEGEKFREALEILKNPVENT